MKEMVLVTVTGQDIILGQDTRKNKGGRRSQSCPIARATSRALNQKVSVSLAGISAMKPHYRHVAYLPDIATDAMKRFDSRQEVFPFSFKIEVSNAK